VDKDKFAMILAICSNVDIVQIHRLLNEISGKSGLLFSPRNIISGAISTSIFANFYIVSNLISSQFHGL
jgi:hypothetical protein